MSNVDALRFSYSPKTNYQ